MTPSRSSRSSNQVYKEVGYGVYFLAFGSLLYINELLLLILALSIDLASLLVVPCISRRFL